MVIRKAKPDDAPMIAELESRIFEDAWDVKDIFSYICQESGTCYVAIDDSGEVIAYTIGRIIPPEGELYRIATREDKRRRGIGYRLLDYMHKCERGRGLECLFLEVRSKNIPARNLYKSYGFCEMGMRKNYYKNPDDDAVVMLKAHRNDMP